MEVYKIIAEIAEFLERLFVKNIEYISTLAYIISGEMSSTNVPNYFDNCHFIQHRNVLWIPT